MKTGIVNVVGLVAVMVAVLAGASSDAFQHHVADSRAMTGALPTGLVLGLVVLIVCRAGGAGGATAAILAVAVGAVVVGGLVSSADANRQVDRLISTVPGLEDPARGAP
jgi:hypothetical protein